MLEYYNSLERPVYNDSDAINLTFGLTLQQIIDVVSTSNHGINPNPEWVENKKFIFLRLMSYWNRKIYMADLYDRMGSRNRVNQ